MPKKQPPTRNPLRLFSRFWKRKSKYEKFILIFFTILGTFILTNIIIHQVRIAYERAQYTRAIADLDTLYDEIAAKVGPADEVSNAQACDYTSLKYGRGPRYCTIYKKFIYKDISREQAVKISRGLESTITASEVATFVRDDDDGGVNPYRKDFPLPIFNLPHIGLCGTDMQFVSRTSAGYIPRYGNPTTDFIYGYGLSIKLSCSGGDQAEYFPVPE